MQFDIKHTPGTFAACRTCKREPKHVESRGCPGVRHAIECVPCDQRTARHERLSQAQTQWNALQAPERDEHRLRIAR